MIDDGLSRKCHLKTKSKWSVTPYSVRIHNLGGGDFPIVWGGVSKDLEVPDEGFGPTEGRLKLITCDTQNSFLKPRVAVSERCTP